MSMQEEISIIGLAKARENWLKNLESANMPHAYLICGENGVGRTTFVRFCLQSVGLRAEEGLINNPDIFLLEREINEKTGKTATSITVESVRRLKSHFFETALMGGYRAAVVEGAEKLNENAVNALLKVVEEPPNKRLFFLITSMPGNIPATLASRLSKIYLENPAHEEVKEWARKKFPEYSEEEITKAVKLGVGMPGKVNKILSDKKHFKEIIKLKDLFDSWISGTESKWKIISSVEDILGKSDELKRFIDIWESFGNRALGMGIPEEKKLEYATNIENLLATLEKSKKLASSNVGKRLILDQLVINSTV